jgi:hypothetical protein
MSTPHARIASSSVGYVPRASGHAETSSARADDPKRALARSSRTPGVREGYCFVVSLVLLTVHRVSSAPPIIAYKVAHAHTNNPR